MPTILVADDNSNIQKMVSLVFKEKGIRVVAVGNGEAACRKVPEVQPDVVLADVFMPVRNGYEVCEFVKQDPQFAETPVILLVGAFDPLDEKEAQRVGANGVLKKPFVPPEPLIAMVSSLLKLEPPAEEAQPVQAAEEALAPQVPEESGPTARQIAIAAAQAQYAAAETDETVTTFSAPVAIPSTQGQEVEKEEDDSEPGSEWMRRRASMDYEIDSADSANMVEKLAAERTAEEPEILPSTKHLPFGGANVPEALSEPSKRADLAVPELPIEPIVAASEPETAPPEISVPLEEASPAPNFGNTASGYGSGFDSAAPHFMPADEVRVEAPQGEPEAERAPAEASPLDFAPARPVFSEPVAHTRGNGSEAASASWPLPHSHVDAEESSAGLNDTAMEESHGAAASQSSEKQPAWQAASEPPLALPEAPNATASAPAETVAKVVSRAVETPVEKPSTKAPIDQATIDDVVAKVISKLEPQLHQALANGVLRPLVEELLTQQRDKK